jgi:cytochrome c
MLLHNTSIRSLLLAVFACSLMANPVYADARGTAGEAKAMVEKATSFMRVYGKDRAFVEFNKKPGRFTDRDLYIFVSDLNGTILAHGANKTLIGRNIIELKDIDGKYFIKQMLLIARTKGSGWVDYKWNNPSTSKIETKSTFLQRVGSYLICCGVYKQ